MNGAIARPIPRYCGRCGHLDTLHYDSAFADGQTCGWMDTSIAWPGSIRCSCDGFVPSKQDLDFPPNELRPRMVA